ncbi:hypothetical protein EFY87_15230 [Flexivirga caeni]|uniref:Uncharacterized protein n=1 Tax=Flexivirga caeni TaxID=2294115 RepID=A0A3M9M421_9MICO|nr:hypothetical protein EFY87_15230 [Flexivirga caeni]
MGKRFWLTWSVASVSYAGGGPTVGALPLLAASITRDPRLVSLSDAVTFLGWVLLAAGFLRGTGSKRWLDLVD